MAYRAVGFLRVKATLQEGSDSFGSLWLTRWTRTAVKTRRRPLRCRSKRGSVAWFRESEGLGVSSNYALQRAISPA